MSSREKFGTKKFSNIKRTSTYINDKSPSRSISKKNNIQEKPKLKMSYNPKFVSSFQKKLENEEENNFSDLSQDEEYKENREKQLEIIYAKYSKLYDSKEKIYANIIKEIDVEKKLFFKKSIMSFNLLILKIKCLMKLLKEKFENNLNSKDERNYYEVDMYIQKIKNEFKKVYEIINVDSKYEYEIVTQIYCKFLYIMAIISNKKEEFIRSFSYITLGVNMLKVYFVRQNIAKDIETYKIYAKLLILLINKFLTDNNISQSLIYIHLLSKINEIGLNFVYKKKLNKKYEYKFNRLNGYNFLFLGYCYELKNNIQNINKITLKIYTEAFYFMTKSNNLSIFAEVRPIITIERKALYLSQLLYEKLKDKIVYEALEKQREFERQEKMKKQLIEEAKSREKMHRLKLISSGLTPEPNNLIEIEHKIYNQILTPSNQKLIDKLDDELISYVYKAKQNRNDNDKKEGIKIKNLSSNRKKKGCVKLEKQLPSMEIMKSLCHYKIYNSLMSNDFKEFLITNKKLKFNNPQQQKTSLDKIQKFLNRKMEIDSTTENAKEKDKDKDKIKESNLIIKTETNISSENNIKSKIVNLKINNNINNKKYRLVEKPKNNEAETNTLKKIKKQQSKTTERTFNKNNNRTFIISRDKENNKQKFDSNSNNKRLITYSNYAESNSNKNKRYNSTGSGYLENRKLDKFVFNKKYFKEYIYLENLTNKELDFQKQFLESKNNNSKMYFKGYDNELTNQGKISRDDIYNSFLIMNDNITSRDRDYEKEMKSEIEIKKKPKILGNVFKSVNNKIKEGKEVKNAMRKVLDNYIHLEKKNQEKKSKNMINMEEIKKKNEYSIMKLNDNIKEINYLLVSKINEAESNGNKYTSFLKFSDI